VLVPHASRWSRIPTGLYHNEAGKAEAYANAEKTECPYFNKPFYNTEKVEEYRALFTQKCSSCAQRCQVIKRHVE
jgi:hypothetical protein